LEPVGGGQTTALAMQTECYGAGSALSPEDAPQLR